jgi:hypothetical protein
MACPAHAKQEGNQKVAAEFCDHMHGYLMPKACAKYSMGVLAHVRGGIWGEEHPPTALNVIMHPDNEHRWHMHEYVVSMTNNPCPMLPHQMLFVHVCRKQPIHVLLGRLLAQL